MGRKTTKPKAGSPWPLIILFMLPLAGLAALMLVVNSVPPRTKAELRAEQEQRQAAVDTVAESGTSLMTNTAGIHVMTLPSAQALSITPRAAMELAMTTRDRTGGIVRVVSPAGQVLAETE